MTISSPGIGSNLDVNSIVSQLMAVERHPLSVLTTKETAFKAQLSAYGTVKSALASFQSALTSLTSGGNLGANTATAGDPSVLSATASSSAMAGSFNVEVTQLARQQKLASGQFANTTDVVGSGTITIQFGTFDATGNTFSPNAAKATKTISISPSNNTLGGIRDAINNAGAGVAASIVNDGTGNRLVITSTDSGQANSLRITTADDDGNNTDAAGLSQLAFDPTAAVAGGKNLSQVSAAQNALFTVDGISISKASNTVTDAIEGVTLNLLKTNSGSPTTLTVGRDSTSVQTAVGSFVDAFNAVNKTLSDLTAYDASTKIGAVLQTDSLPKSLKSEMRAILNGALGGPAGSLTSLSDIGVTFQRDGTLALDKTKLQKAIDGNFSGIAGLFAAVATSTDSLTSFAGSNAKTQAGSYAVAVTQLAARASVAGSQAAALTITAGVNDQIDVTVDGVAASVSIAPGTYATADQLAAELQSKINGAIGGTSGVVVSNSAGVLGIAATHFGAADSISINGGNGAASLFGAAPSVTLGQDVAGTINGVAASGIGQTLTGASGDASEGLRILIAGGALGSRGSVTFTRGYADQLNNLVNQVLGSDGSIASRTDGINARLKDLSKREDDMNERLTAIEARYRAQFTALDAMISGLNSTSTFLTQQLANLPKINGTSSN